MLKALRVDNPTDDRRLGYAKEDRKRTGEAGKTNRMTVTNKSCLAIPLNRVANQQQPRITVMALRLEVVTETDSDEHLQVRHPVTSLEPAEIDTAFLHFMPAPLCEAWLKLAFNNIHQELKNKEHPH
eukprot:2097829-Amphidinium_carterae.1